MDETRFRAPGHASGERTMMELRAAALLVTIVGLLAGSAMGADPAEAELHAFFEKRIRPLLIERCVDCHGADYQESGLQLDSPEGLLKGGKAGPIVVPGKPEQSLLITAVGYQDNTLQMPPDGKLSAREIADLTEWIKKGAVVPGVKADAIRRGPSIDLEEARQFWSLQPIVDPPVPNVAHATWPKNEIDRFILAKLEEKGLEPAPPADKRTLLRRAAFDLTGLPPTAEDLATFLGDDSPEAFARAVDRLLASPAYGERWGRHWLDVARYADSNGLDENVAHGNAWRYRDYVIRAFNTDKPYDQFVTEQLAGDLLPADDPAQRHEQLTATGFLVLGPKGLAEVDKVKLEMDIIDEQLDTLGRAFMGLTFGCARCHDHKFDPVLATDYYALAGILKSTKTMDSLKTIAKWHENTVATSEELAKKAEHDAQVAAQKQKVDEFIKTANAALQATLAEGEKLPAKPETKYPAETQAELKALRDELAALEKAAPVLPSAMGVEEGTVAEVAVHIRGSHLTLGEVPPRRFPLVLAGVDQPPLPSDQSGRLQLARWMTSADHPLTSRVMVNRIWRWHFGTGLVATPDNFGRLGETPSHPELLDWLARRFVEGGWSIKSMHRMILLSNTWQMSSRHNPKATEIDPENRLLWRVDVRRLEAEELRDAVLAVSGQLDRTAGGSILNTANYTHVFDHTSKDRTTYDTLRRSVYLPVIRNNLYDIFQIFDYSDADVINGDRPSSTVAPQALFILNSDLMASSSSVLATTLLESPADDDRTRINALYERVLGRPASAAEVARAETGLNRFLTAFTDHEPDGAKRRHAAWSTLCHVLLASNEFISLR